MSALPNVEATVKLLGAILSGPLDLVAEKKRFQALLQDYAGRARAEQVLNLRRKHLNALVLGMLYPRFDEVVAQGKAHPVGLRGLGDWLSRQEGYKRGLCQWVEVVWSRSLGLATDIKLEPRPQRARPGEAAPRPPADELAPLEIAARLETNNEAEPRSQRARPGEKAPRPPADELAPLEIAARLETDNEAEPRSQRARPGEKASRRPADELAPLEIAARLETDNEAELRPQRGRPGEKASRRPADELAPLEIATRLETDNEAEPEPQRGKSDQEARRQSAEEQAMPGEAGIRRQRAAAQQARARRLRHEKQRQAARPVKPVEAFRDSLRDGGQGPAMVVLPPGRFRMGDLDGSGNSNERPVRTVTISHRIAMGKYTVTFEEYDQFVTATDAERPADEGWGRGSRPVINVNWLEAKAYAAWLSEQTGKRYRLPSEAEWEYAARAGTETAYSWGDEIGVNRANGHDSGSEWSHQRTSPVGSFAPNDFGLYDMHGNVWEWSEDYWHRNYEGAPADGSAWLSGGRDRSRVVRGGAWYVYPPGLRAAYRDKVGPSIRIVNIGFRLVKDLTP